MNRRRFIKLSAIGAAALALPVKALSAIGTRKYGRVSVHDSESERLARRCAASVNGIDVTDRCFEANDIEGYALCYVEDGHGRSILNDDGTELVTERLTGNVRIWEKWQ
jgi:hypothetical protein